MKNILIVCEFISSEHESDAMGKGIFIPYLDLTIIANGRAGPEKTSVFPSNSFLMKAKTQLFKIIYRIGLAPVTHCPILPLMEIN